MAQFIFKPGSGQPTLLWLDTVRTVRSTQQLGDHTPGEIGDPTSEFFQLTHDLGQGISGRSWTTFFPPKVADLMSGGGSPGLTEQGRAVGSRRSAVFRRTVDEHSLMAGGGAREENNVSAEEISIAAIVPTTPANATDAKSGTHTPADAMGEKNGSTGVSEEEEVGRVRNNDINLPTESWAHRSAGRRGLYCSRTGGAGGRYADQSLNKQWPRKRSTGTTMRRDCNRGRLDLRNAAENQRPWTSPLTQATQTGTGLPEGGSGLVGVGG